MSKRERWEEFVLCRMPPECIKYRKLMAQQDPESAPYQSRYAAADVQERLLDAARTFDGADADDLFVEINDQRVSYHTVVGRLHVRKGLALIETDLLADAEKALLSGLERLARTEPCQDPCIKMAALNNLGILHCNRESFDSALTHLAQVEATYDQVKQGSTDCTLSQGLNRVEDQADQAASVWLEELYTLALFYLAQAHQKRRDEARAADYCAKTLCRQLKFGMSGVGGSDSVSQDGGTWVQNAAQLACFYFNDGKFAVAEHVLNAATAMVAKAKAAGTQLEEDVEANVQLGWARYLLARMDQSVSLRSAPEEEGAALQPDGPTELPTTVRFDGLQLPPPSALPWGARAVATSFEEMRTLFNAAMRHLRDALKFYQLEGWVTEHVELLFDIARAYQNLAWFESDPHRRCVMHRQRITQFAAVDNQLSFQHYPGLVRSVMLETASAYRDIFDIKASNGWPASKVLAAGKEACHHYARFLATMVTDGALPATLDPEWERPVLNACMANARICNKVSGVDDADQLTQLRHARDCARYATDYVARNQVSGFEEEAALCQEFLILIEQKLLLLETARP